MCRKHAGAVPPVTPAPRNGTVIRIQILPSGGFGTAGDGNFAVSGTRYGTGMEFLPEVPSGMPEDAEKHPENFVPAEIYITLR